MGRYVFLLILFLILSCSDNEGDAAMPNSNIDLGVITDDFYEQNGNFVFSTETTTRTYRFEINSYSRLELTIHDHYGSFELYNETTKSTLTHNGGVLGGGSSFIAYSNTGNLTIELHEGIYSLTIKNDEFERDNEGTFSISISNINELKPYENLGQLSLPHNAVYTPIPDRAATIYDFEITEPITTKIFVNGLIDSNTRLNLVMTNEIGEELYSFGRPNIIPLAIGKYQLRFSWGDGFAFILGNAEAGDQDFGVIPTDTPYSMKIDVDFRYETDDVQKVFFETTESTQIEGLEYLLTPFSTFLYKNDGTPISDYENLAPGKYYLSFEADYIAYAVNNDVNNTVYKVLTGSYELIFTEN